MFRNLPDDAALPLLGWLGLIGLAVVALAANLIPPTVVWGIAWLAEPRTGVAPLWPWLVAQALWTPALLIAWRRA